MNYSFKSPLLLAVNNRRLEVVKLLLDSGANPNLCTPLLHIARHGFTAAAKELIKAGANVDVRDANGRTPLLLAISNSFSSLANLLIKADACPNIRDNDYCSPLYLASKMKQTSVVKNLLSKDADPNIRTASGFTSLHIAADLGYFTIVKILLKAGADPLSMPWSYNTRPIDLAKSSRHFKIVELLQNSLL